MTVTIKAEHISGAWRFASRPRRVHGAQDQYGHTERETAENLRAVGVAHRSGRLLHYAECTRKLLKHWAQSWLLGVPVSLTQVFLD